MKQFLLCKGRPMSQLFYTELRGLGEEQFCRVMSVMEDDFVRSPTYKLRYPAHAFLQGADQYDGWVMIEFWSKDEGAIQVFIDHLNEVVFTAEA